MERQSSPNRISWIVYTAVIAILAAALLPYWPQFAAGFAHASPHAPNWRLWSELSPILKVHVAAALLAFVVGMAIFLRRKGSGLHKILGWGFVIAMTMTAGTSLFVTGLNGSSYSLIHLLSGWTLIALPLGIFAIRNGKVEGHQRAMTGLFVGGLGLAGALTFIPGRFMFEFFFG
jgi:uncharacterized membrane protein